MIRFGLIMLGSLLILGPFAKARASETSFKWRLVISELGTSSSSSQMFDAAISRKKIATAEGDCYLSLLPLHAATSADKAEQSANLTCNSFTIGALCRQGDPNNGWLSGVFEGKKHEINISVTCDQFDGTSFHDGWWDQLKALLLLSTPHKR